MRKIFKSTGPVVFFWGFDSDLPFPDIRTTSGLKVLAEFWWNQLYLQQWRVRIICEDLKTPGLRGRVMWEGSHRDATILLNTGYDWDGKRVAVTLVHELLHLRFASLGDPCPECVEESVSRLAYLLVAGKAGEL